MTTEFIRYVYGTIRSMLAALGITLVLKELWYLTILLWMRRLFGKMALKGILSPMTRGPKVRLVVFGTAKA